MADIVGGVISERNLVGVLVGLLQQGRSTRSWARPMRAARWLARSERWLDSAQAYRDAGNTRAEADVLHGIPLEHPDRVPAVRRLAEILLARRRREAGGGRPARQRGRPLRHRAARSARFALRDAGPERPRGAAAPECRAAAAAAIAGGGERARARGAIRRAAGRKLPVPQEHSHLSASRPATFAISTVSPTRRPGPPSHLIIGAGSS